MSAFAVVLWAFAATIVLRQGGAAVISWPAGLAQWGTWILVGLLALAVLMNAISPSGLERLVWVPYSLLLGALCFLVAHN